MATILRSGDVYIQNRKGGKILETDEGYQFQYLPEYLNNHPVPASLTLPLQSGPYQSQTLFPFFHSWTSHARSTLGSVKL
ncbi:HipA N-terminal domain-containing protein, partial [Faecalibaculum rodentium]|uniref:HipA N-terminal domain-containing protein n=3 Tax=Faecalibaculum rodentium TaxID=1702221 RepID=UPI0034E3F4C2